MTKVNERNKIFKMILLGGRFRLPLLYVLSVRSCTFAIRDGGDRPRYVARVLFHGDLSRGRSDHAHRDKSSRHHARGTDPVGLGRARKIQEMWPALFTKEAFLYYLYDVGMFLKNLSIWLMFLIPIILGGWMLVRSFLDEPAKYENGEDTKPLRLF